MAFTGASLADGQIAAAWATIYTSTAKTIVKSFHIFNTSATPQTVEVRVTRSGSTARAFPRVVLSQNESAQYVSDGDTLVLSASDIIEAQSTTLNVVDYTITGATE